MNLRGIYPVGGSAGVYSNLDNTLSGKNPEDMDGTNGKQTGDLMEKMLGEFL